MGGLLSLVVALLTAVAGCLGAGFLADVCVGWYRISSREGASGYFVVFMGLLGLVLGFVLGLVCARVVAAGAQPGFLKALGVALGSATALLAVAAALAWLGAEFPPRLEGRLLAVEVEVRLPPGSPRPAVPQEKTYSWHVTITADGGSRRQSLEPLRAGEARQEDGRWVVPALLDLDTTDSGKQLGVKLGGEKTQYFRMSLAGHPSRRDFEWSPWLTKSTWGDLSAVAAAEACEVRYRAQFRPEPSPPPNAPSREEAEAEAAGQEQAALDGLRDRPGVDLRPGMRQILELARVRGESLAMQGVARVSGYYAGKWEE